MITDARVPDEEYVPLDVPHRNAELNHLSTAFEPIERGRPGETTMLFGPTGTGKTCLAKYMLRQLRKQVGDVQTHYVNCWENYTRYRVLMEVLAGPGRSYDIHRSSNATDELLHRIQKYDGPPYGVILDEVDQLKETEILYDLYRSREITMILIANREEELFAKSEDRLVSRFHGARRIQLDRYRLSELVEILEKRVDRGLRPGAIDRKGLEKVADVAAGDARTAIAVLRNTAMEAEDRGQTEISTELIEEIVPKTTAELTQKTVDRLHELQQAVYNVLKEGGKMPPGEIYERYCERVEDPNSDRMIRSYLKKLEHYDLIESMGSTRDRRYRVTETGDT